MSDRFVAVFKHFKIIDGVNRKASCNYCKKSLSFNSTISNLKYHLKLRHLEIYREFFRFRKKPESEDDNGTPLYNMLRYIANIPSNKQITVLSNSKLIDILRMDFLWDLTDMSELDLDVYLNVLKRFLKLWPEWQEYDKTIRELQKKELSINQILAEEYQNLKTYLEEILMYTKSKISQIVEEIKMEDKTVNSNPKVRLGDEVVMEVSCTRTQLNNLFYRKPHPENNSIFHISDDPLSSKISLASIKFKEILNWPNVTIYVNLPTFEYIRKNSSSFQRTLINRKLPENDTKTLPVLSSNLYWRRLPSMQVPVRKTAMVSYILQLLTYISKLEVISNAMKDMLVDLFKEIKTDFVMAFDTIAITSQYQFFMSRYPYLRYVCNDITENTLPQEMETNTESINMDDFDLQLEEIISPAITFQLLRHPRNIVDTKAWSQLHFKDNDYTSLTRETSSWITLECNWCGVRFEGLSNMFHAEQHFTECHSMEPEWQCGRCQQVFSMNSLAASRWFHKC